jgi:hypothetical protein
LSSHRKNIREAIVETLIDFPTDCGARVYANRVRPVFQTELPLILVQTKTESVELFAESGPREYKRVLQVDVVILAEADESCDDVLDLLGAQVEAALNERHTLDADGEDLCEDVILRGADMGIEKEGNNLLGALRLNYEVPYYTQPVNDAENLEFLNRVDIEYDLQVSGTENPTDIVDGLSAL